MAVHLSMSMIFLAASVTALIFKGPLEDEPMGTYNPKHDHEIPSTINRYAPSMDVALEERAQDAVQSVTGGIGVMDRMVRANNRAASEARRAQNPLQAWWPSLLDNVEDEAKQLGDYINTEVDPPRQIAEKPSERQPQEPSPRPL
eukprot:gnl/MRDRNA2_/MRDRNA2_33068_c0_seq1.p1 gnl/MRDRNA2_/MRDRNA2_33068_c0~~gnl/MRDRNA2_/MRDRNA2_33068_c0_seq1.p1  ORF type:complete len:145 (+),score=27.33 gnl/MRDRNA2_/MRDRNA2_33068_c0_seq1:99-533(+)